MSTDKKFENMGALSLQPSSPPAQSAAYMTFAAVSTFPPTQSQTEVKSRNTFHSRFLQELCTGQGQSPQFSPSAV